MSTEPGNTLTDEEIAALAVGTEQTTIKPLDEERAPELVSEDKEAPPAPAAKKDDEPPADPRAARLEALADKAHQHRQEEAETVAEIMAPAAPVKEPEPAPVPERMLKLKIRGEVVEMSESEVIARAQKVDAADQYIAEAKDLLRDAKAVRQQPQPVQELAPQPTPEKPNAIAKALEIVQAGGDLAEAQAMIETELSERATRAAEQVVDGRNENQRSQRYDADMGAGFAEAATEFPDLMASPVGQSTVRGLTGSLQAHVIAEHLQTLTPEVQQAFSASGITPESLKDYSPDDAGALYKDMLLKGYRLPRPSEVTKAAAKTVADFYAGSTQPAPAPTPAPAPQILDRTQRKEALNNPERTAIPKPTGRTPPPRTEPQRAASARQELRASRRRGSA